MQQADSTHRSPSHEIRMPFVAGLWQRFRLACNLTWEAWLDWQQQQEGLDHEFNVRR